MKSKNNNKRKHDHLDLESKDSGAGTVGETASSSSTDDDLRPDITTSSANPTAPDGYFEIPEKFNSDIELEKLLSNITLLPGPHDDNIDGAAAPNQWMILRRDQTVQALSQLKDWSSYSSKEKLAFQASFLKLSGPIRFQLFIEVHMREPKLVSLAVDVLSNCLNLYLGRIRRQLKSTRELLHQNKCLRTLQLAVEEFRRPSSEAEWEAIRSLWRFISDQANNLMSKTDHDDFSSFMESSVKNFIDITIPQPLIQTAFDAVWFIFRALRQIGYKSKPLLTKYGKALCLIRQFCEKYSSDLSSTSTVRNYGFLLIINDFIQDNTLCEEEIIGWVRVIMHVIPAEPTENWLDLNLVYFSEILSYIIDEKKVDRAKLVSQTTLVTFISQVIQAPVFQRQEEYRKLMVKLMTY